MKALVVVPTYNEAATLPTTLTKALAASPEVDVLVADDNSPDGTGALADELAATEPHVAVLHRAAKQGLGPAYVAGFRWGLDRGYEAFVEMDADLSHDPADLPRLLEAAASHDVVLGSRYTAGGAVRNWSQWRERLSRGGNTYARLALGIPVADVTAGYRCYRRAVLETIPLDQVGSQGYTFQIEMAWRAWTLGFDIVEIPITFTDRAAGTSKMSQRIVAEALWRVLGFGLRFRRPPSRPHPRSIRAPTDRP